jgi:hypothetical protein
MNQPIVFLSPQSVAGDKGYQVIDDETHEVTAVALENGDPAPEPCSYRGIDA